MKDQRPLVLIILDGWGVNPRTDGNAIALASTPNMDRLTARYPTTVITISGSEVGLPKGQMGNSEVGHMHLGSGRIVCQDLTLIHRAIEEGDFFSNPVLLAVLQAVNQAKGRLHLMGLLGDGGVHAHQRHMEALIELGRRRKIEEIYLHLFLDGRDTAPKSAEGFLAGLVRKIESSPGVKIATVSGRYYSMDRDRRWERTQKAYLCLTEGIGPQAVSALEAIRGSYRDGLTDEFVLPTVIQECFPRGMIRDGDGLIFFNFRADRARQMTRAFAEAEFKEFPRERRIALSGFATMTEYDATFDLPSIFPPKQPRNTLGEIAGRAGIPQLRIAETEKYAHVTYFFNGGEESKFPFEDRILVPSTKEVPTYDQKPSMSAREITETLLKKVAERQYGLIILNYANTDMVGHTGNFEATVQACEVVDECVGRVVTAVLNNGGRSIVTADHGNAEQMIYYDSGNIHTAHTTNQVPVILVDQELRSCRLSPGSAIDVAPTILRLFGIPKPPEMTGRSLITDP